MKLNLVFLALLFLLPGACTQNKKGQCYQDPETGISASVPAEKMFYTFGAGAMNDSLARLYKSLGVTSVESYVTWETCEREAEGNWDWSEWDTMVKVLKENNMKWVPFLILAPAYSTPDWFRASEEHVPCRCLEHGIDSKIESLWNPHLPKRVDRFIEEFSKRYKESGVIESVLLGIQGDFGEAIYSVWGGGWTFNVPGEYHNHAGYWCDDPYALESFQEFIKKRYEDISELNRLWGTGFTAYDEVDFPGRKDELSLFEERVSSGDPLARWKWLDFIDWYRSDMTELSDWWIKTTRKHFPDDPIYLCTGGDAVPQHGSNFAEQSRVAAKYGAGVRITNEGSNYKDNFSLTRWVASSGKHYGAYYGFEPAGAENEKGIVARIYNATASGANQLHDYASNVTSTRDRTDAQQKHLKYLFHVESPIVPVALWYPNVSLTINWEAKESPDAVSLNSAYINNAAKFRDYSDFDFVDESMLRTGALSHNRILVIIHGEIMEPSDAKLIAAWAKKGGHVIVMDVPVFESVEATSEPEQILFGSKETEERKIGKGRIVRVSGWENLSEQLGTTLNELHLPVCDLKEDSIFATQTGKKNWLILNTADQDSEINIQLPDNSYSFQVKQGTITEVNLQKN